MIRQPIISVMGHVDHGKTTLLDRIRNSAIAAKEAGGITQHIGASEVPISVIEQLCGPMLRAFNSKITLPGVLFIDTPGHEAFTNLRRRGGSVADLAILVVDITEGFAPQTIEAVEILREFKTPFIVAANKVDLIVGWRNSNTNSITDALRLQNASTLAEIDSDTYKIVGELSKLGFSSESMSRIKDFKSEVAIVPISAKTGEGIAEILMLVTGLAQRFLELRLNIEVNGKGKGNILEKKETRGLGVTIDAILYDGTLRVNDTIAFATPDGIKTSKIKALIEPRPLADIGEGGKYAYVDEVSAASGIKISGTSLDDAIPGSPLIQVIGKDYASEINAELSGVFQTDRYGIILKADSIGSIEAISKLLASEGATIGKKGIGNISKRDVIDAFSMNTADAAYAAVLAFNVKIEDDALLAALESRVKIIQSDIIYKLVEDYAAFAAEKRKSTTESIEKKTTFPGKIEILPNTAFRISNPAIFGVRVLEGRLRPGYPLMSANGVVIGRLLAIQHERIPVDGANKDDEIAISVEGPSFGRQVKDGQILYTRPTDEEQNLLNTTLFGMLDDSEKELLRAIADIKRQQHSA